MGLAFVGFSTFAATAAPLCATDDTPMSQQKQQCQRPMLTAGESRTDTLTNRDIPTGDGGFFRDYEIVAQKDDNLLIDLRSNEFDTVVSLLRPDGTLMGENDDRPGGGTDSLLFMPIEEGGTYIIRVRAFGETGGGRFTLRVSRLVEASGSNPAGRPAPNNRPIPAPTSLPN
ncbi:MAG: peptidase [Spirulina sp. DLM2.Bin59]|nr:MAG: peptidase [Spirulina sp. DLM2.Bin59]